jgi:chromosome segregation ATPase
MHADTHNTRTPEGLIKSSLSALEALSETLSLGLKDVARLKQEMTLTRAHMHDGSEAKVLKDKLTELQGKVHSVCDETAGLKTLVTLVKDEAAAAKNKMEGSEEVARIKADVASSKSALEKLQADYRAQQLKILELDGVKQQISGLKEDAGIQN